MTRDELRTEIIGMLGMMPGWMDAMPDPVLDQYWTTTKWLLSDTALSARDKALVAFGAASALHCEY